jgi:hypothetical protein
VQANVQLVRGTIRMVVVTIVLCRTSGHPLGRTTGVGVIGAKVCFLLDMARGYALCPHRCAAPAIARQAAATTLCPLSGDDGGLFRRARPNSLSLFKIADVLVRLDHVA